MDIKFAGDGAKDVSLMTSTAEARSASTSKDGPIKSPVPDPGTTMNTGDLQKYANTPSKDAGGKGITFTEGTSKD